MPRWVLPPTVCRVATAALILSYDTSLGDDQTLRSRQAENPEHRLSIPSYLGMMTILWVAFAVRFRPVFRSRRIVSVPSSFRHPPPANCRLPLELPSDFWTTIDCLLSNDLWPSTSLKHWPSVRLRTLVEATITSLWSPFHRLPTVTWDSHFVVTATEPVVLSPSQGSKFSP